MDIPKFKLSEAEIGQRVVVVEPRDEEIRWSHFTRRELADGEPLFNPQYLAVTSLRTVQGTPGQKPRYDSGEHPYPSQMPGAVLVVDGSYVNHDWTEAYEGLMIVTNQGWISIYLNAVLIWHQQHYQSQHTMDEALALVKVVVEAGDTSIAHMRAVWKPGQKLFPTDLTQLKLEPILEPDARDRLIRMFEEKSS